MKDVRAVIFDLGGTLLHPESVGQTYARIGEKYGVRLEPGELADRFRRAFARQEEIDRERGWRTDEAREWCRWRDIVAECIPGTTDPDACFRELYDHYAQGSAWELAEDAPVLLRDLRDRGLLVGVASNFDGRLHQVIEDHPPLRDLPLRLISAEIGWRKPAAEFFAALVDRTGSAPGEILYVGDDRRWDFEGARSAGLQAVLLDGKGRHRDLGAGRIERLGDLVGCLGAGSCG